MAGRLVGKNKKSPEGRMNKGYLAETKAAIDQNQHLPSIVIILVFMRVTEGYLHQPHPTDIIQIQI